MARRKLTTLAIPTLPAGEYWDTVQPGLVLRVGANRRSWSVRHRVAGKNRRDPLGHFPAVSLADARKRTGELFQRVEAGAPPVAPEPHPRAASRLTLAELFDLYEARRKREGGRNKSLGAVMRMLRRTMKPWLTLPARSIGKADIKMARDAMMERGNDAAAALFLRSLGPVMRWAAIEDHIETNHVPSVLKPSLKPRERVLNADEVRAIWSACEAAPTPSALAFRRLVRFLLASGQRVDEAASLRYRDVVGGVWRQADNKSGRPHAVPLSGLAASIVGDGDADALVFRGRSGKLSGFSKLKAELDRACGVRNWRLHDLRRTAATRMQDAGVPREVVEAILNHAIQGVGGVYLRGDMEALKRNALERWADELSREVSPRDSLTP